MTDTNWWQSDSFKNQQPTENKWWENITTNTNISEPTKEFKSKEGWIEHEHKMWNGTFARMRPDGAYWLDNKNFDWAPKKGNWYNFDEKSNMFVQAPSKDQTGINKLLELSGESVMEPGSGPPTPIDPGSVGRGIISGVKRASRATIDALMEASGVSDLAIPSLKPEERLQSKEKEKEYEAIGRSGGPGASGGQMLGEAATQMGIASPLALEEAPLSAIGKIGSNMVESGALGFISTPGDVEERSKEAIKYGLMGGTVTGLSNLLYKGGSAVKGLLSREEGVGTKIKDIISEATSKNGDPKTNLIDAIQNNLKTHQDQVHRLYDKALNETGLGDTIINSNTIKSKLDDTIKDLEHGGSMSPVTSKKISELQSYIDQIEEAKIKGKDNFRSLYGLVKEWNAKAEQAKLTKISIKPSDYAGLNESIYRDLAHTGDSLLDASADIVNPEAEVARSMYSNISKISREEWDKHSDDILKKLSEGKHQLAETGSGAEFTKFDPKFIGSGSGLANKGHGFYHGEIGSGLADIISKSISQEKGLPEVKYVTMIPSDSRLVDLQKTFEDQTPEIQEKIKNIPTLIRELGGKTPSAQGSAAKISNDIFENNKMTTLFNDVTAALSDKKRGYMIPNQEQYEELWRKSGIGGGKFTGELGKTSYIIPNAEDSKVVSRVSSTGNNFDIRKGEIPDDVATLKPPEENIMKATPEQVSLFKEARQYSKNNVMPYRNKGSIGSDLMSAIESRDTGKIDSLLNQDSAKLREAYNLMDDKSREATRATLLSDLWQTALEKSGNLKKASVMLDDLKGGRKAAFDEFFKTKEDRELLAGFRSALKAAEYTKYGVIGTGSLVGGTIAHQMGLPTTIGALAGMGTMASHEATKTAISKKLFEFFTSDKGQSMLRGFKKSPPKILSKDIPLYTSLAVSEYIKNKKAKGEE